MKYCWYITNVLVMTYTCIEYCCYNTVVLGNACPCMKSKENTIHDPTQHKSHEGALILLQAGNRDRYQQWVRRKGKNHQITGKTTCTLWRTHLLLQPFPSSSSCCAIGFGSSSSSAAFSVSSSWVLIAASSVLIAAGSSGLLESASALLASGSTW